MCATDFPGGPVVKTSPSSTGGAGSISSRGAKAAHGAGQLSPRGHNQDSTCSNLMQLKINILNNIDSYPGGLGGLKNLHL